jgi:hypothetical protein
MLSKYATQTAGLVVGALVKVMDQALSFAVQRIYKLRFKFTFFAQRVDF